MELTNEQILIQLPEGTDKNAMFEIIALANGWTPTTPKRVEKEKVITGTQEDYNAHFNSIKENPWFEWLGAFAVDETSEKHTWAQTEEVENIEATVFGKNILVAQMFDTFGKAKIQLDTQAEQIALAEKQEQSKKELETIWNIVVD